MGFWRTIHFDSNPTQFILIQSIPDRPNPIQPDLIQSIPFQTVLTQFNLI